MFGILVGLEGTSDSPMNLLLRFPVRLVESSKQGNTNSAPATNQGEESSTPKSPKRTYNAMSEQESRGLYCLA